MIIPKDAQRAIFTGADLRVRAFLKRIGPAVCPVYIPDHTGAPVVNGSAVLLQFGQTRFLITAAHVMDDAKAHDFYVGGDEEIVGISAPYQVSVGPGSRQHDKVDLAVVKLGEKDVQRLGPRAYISPHWMEPFAAERGPSASKRLHYLSLGFIASKQPPLKDNELVPHLTPSLHGGAPAISYRRLGLDPRTHLLLEFSRKRMEGPNGRITAPRPRGISGGGVWYLPDFMTQHPGIPLLVAITIEYKAASHNVLICTRLGYIVKWILDKYPETYESMRPFMDWGERS
jgi:hypothetical protein